MPKLNFELTFATLIPEFVYQFLSSAQVDKNSITCLDLEDLRDAVKGSTSAELEGIRQFLSAHEVECEVEDEETMTADEKLENMSDKLDVELELVDDEMYHKYTPGELKYIFGEIIDNIDEVYSLYKNHAGINLALSVGFKLKNGLETGLVIEFLSMAETPEFLENVFFIPMANYMASDGILSRMYLVYEKEKEGQYAPEFSEISAVLSLKSGDGAGHEHGPNCGHLH